MQLGGLSLRHCAPGRCHPPRAAPGTAGASPKPVAGLGQTPRLSAHPRTGPALALARTSSSASRCVPAGEVGGGSALSLGPQSRFCRGTRNPAAGRSNWAGLAPRRWRGLARPCPLAATSVLTPRAPWARLAELLARVDLGPRPARPVFPAATQESEQDDVNPASGVRRGLRAVMFLGDTPVSTPDTHQSGDAALPSQAPGPSACAHVHVGGRDPTPWC